MSIEQLSIELFRDFAKTHPRPQLHVRLRGHHMHPALQAGERLTIIPSFSSDLREGDIVLAQIDDRLQVYRIVLRRGDFFLLKGDAEKSPAPPAELRQVLGKVVGHQPYSRMRALWDRFRNQLTRWFSIQLCEMILENQTREI